MRNLSGAEHPATKAVWAGEDGYLVEGATQVPIVQSIPFGYDDLDEWMGVALGEREGHIYSRNTNPTTRAFEEKLRALEEAEDSTSFATGMAAISNTLFAFLTPGDRVVSVKDTYGGTNKIFLEFLSRAGVVNDSTDYRIDAMPFGGVKGSGLRREGVKFALEEMTEPKVACFNLGEVP